MVCAEHRVLVILGGVIDGQIQQETVQLGLGQRVGPRLLNGVLRGQYKKGFFQRVRLATVGHAAFLHGFEQRALGFGRGAVDLVRQHDLAEQWPFVELEEPAARRVVLLQDFRADDVAGHQVGRELDAVEHEVHGLCQRADEQRLAQAGQTLEQAMAARDERREQFLHDRLLADDRLADLAAEQRNFGEQGMDLRFGEINGRCGTHG